jgi:uncharacterized membrane protein YfbV (UPF0208 family)
VTTIKTKLLLMLTMISISAHASSAGANALAGVGIALALMVLGGFYQLGVFATKKFSPQSPIWFQRVLGVFIAFCGYFLIVTLLK